MSEMLITSIFQQIFQIFIALIILEIFSAFRKELIACIIFLMKMGTYIPPSIERSLHYMKEQHIIEITQLLNTLSDEQLLYILTFIEKLFGSH